MLRLFVMRHAKSSWANPGARDFERELNARGKADLVNIAREIEKRGYQPGQVICSPAERTRQTLAGIDHVFTAHPQVSFPNKLYSSGIDDYLEIVRAKETPSPIMIIGHNPTCGGLVAALYGSGAAKLFSQIAMKYPTGTLSVLDFDIPEWKDIQRGSGILVDCILPRKLAKA